MKYPLPVSQINGRDVRLEKQLRGLIVFPGIESGG